MKDAAGEANVTVITIVLIALVMAAGALIIPRLLDNAKMRSLCSEFGFPYSRNLPGTQGLGGCYDEKNDFLHSIVKCDDGSFSVDRCN